MPAPVPVQNHQIYCRSPHFPRRQDAHGGPGWRRRATSPAAPPREPGGLQSPRRTGAHRRLHMPRPAPSPRCSNRVPISIPILPVVCNPDEKVGGGHIRPAGREVAERATTERDATPAGRPTQRRPHHSRPALGRKGGEIEDRPSGARGVSAASRRHAENAAPGSVRQSVVCSSPSVSSAPPPPRRAPAERRRDSRWPWSRT